MATKKRINVTDEVFTKLEVLAAELNVNGKKSNEKVEKLFNDSVLLESYKELKRKNNDLSLEIENLNNNAALIDEEQTKRLEKLKALGIFSGSYNDVIKEMIDIFVEVKKDEIAEAVKGI